MTLSDLEKRYVQALGILSLVCLGFFGFRLLSTGVARYWFIPENLLLAWLSLAFSWLLVKQLNHSGWLSPLSVLLTLLWLLFLPNAWYVMTDFIHVFDSGEISYLYDIAMVTTLTLCGFLLGFASLFIIHRQLLKRLDPLAGIFTIEAVILLASFAIYLGRDLRWSSWDIITDPSGLILSITDRLINPFGHPRALNVTGIFFVLISAMYLAGWLILKPITPKSR